MKKIRKGKVLVLGQDTRSFLTVIRSLGRAGIEVHVGWCPSDSPSKYSRYIHKVHHIPRPGNDKIDWRCAFLRLLKSEKFKLVIPCDDPSIIPLQTNRNCFANISKLAIINDRAFEVTSDKSKVYNLAKSLGIRVPKQREVTTVTQIAEILQEFDPPFVLKPISSFTNDDLVNRKNVCKVFHSSDLLPALSSMLTDGNVLVQENFEGIGSGVEMLAENGAILIAFQHVRVHEPLSGGGSSYRKSVPLNCALLTASSKIIKALHYTGVAMVEFKVNPETGHWVFLETNARFWGSLPLAVSAGVNFPLYLYELLVEGKTEFQQPAYKISLFCRNLTRDIDYVRANIIGKKAFTDRPRYHLPAILWEFIRNTFAEKEKSDTFAIDDLMPALLDLLCWFKEKIDGLKRKIVTLTFRSP